MKQLWMRLDAKASSTLKAELLKAAEGRCNVALLSPDDLALASSLKLKKASTDRRSEIRLLTDPPELDSEIKGEFAAEVVVKDSSDEQKALQLAGMGIRYLIVHCPNWKVIPLENLIARTRNKTTLLADVSSISEAQVAL